MNDINVIAIFGKSASGKNSVQNLLVETYPEIFHKVVSCTTRPKREKDIPGKDYHFISEKEFLKLMLQEQFIEATDFNDWFYGTLISSLDSERINVGVFTPEGIEALIETADAYNINVLPVYVRASDKIRLLRSLLRESDPDVDEIVRRYGTDKEDFSTLSFKYVVVDNDRDKTMLKSIVDSIVDYSEVFFM